MLKERVICTTLWWDAVNISTVRIAAKRLAIPLLNLNMATAKTAIKPLSFDLNVEWFELYRHALHRKLFNVMQKHIHFGQ